MHKHFPTTGWGTNWLSTHTTFHSITKLFKLHQILSVYSAPILILQAHFQVVFDRLRINHYSIDWCQDHLIFMAHNHISYQVLFITQTVVVSTEVN